MRVVHLVDRYLDYSRPWIYQQIVRCPGVDPHVVAFDHADDGVRQFPLPSLIVLRDHAPIRYRLTQRAAWHWRLPARLASSPARNLGADVAHAHFGNVAWAYLPLVRSLKIPFIVSFYGRDMSLLPAADPQWRERYGELFSQADAVLCEGPCMASALESLGCPSAKLRVQRLGVDFDRFPARDRYLIAGEPLRVLLAARFVEKKGVPDAIAAAALAARQVPIALTIVGDADPNDTREAARIDSALVEYNASGLVSFAGRMGHEALARLQTEFHVVLQPSRTSAGGDTEGGAPVGLIECAAAGLAAVATRHADIPEVVVDGHTGLLAEEGDVETLARHLVWLATHPAAVTAMGHAAAAHIRQRFDHVQCLSALRAHYEQVLTNRLTAAH